MITGADHAGVRRHRVAAAVAFGVQGLVFAAVLTRVPALRDRFGLSDGELTAVLAIVPVIAGVGSVLAGRLADRHGSAAVLRVAAVVACAAAAGTGVAPTFWSFALAIAVYGIGLGAVDATMNMQGVAVQARHGHSIMNSFHAVWSLAGIAGALWSAAVADALPLGAGIGAAAAVGAVAITVAGPSLLRDAREPAAAATATAALVPTTEPAEPPATTAPPSTASPEPSGTVAAAAHVPWGALLPIGLVLGCVYVADSGVSNWSAVHLRDVLLTTEGTAALGYAAYQGASLLGRLAGDALVRRHGAVAVARAAAAIAVVGLAVVLVALHPALAIAGFAITGLGASVLVPLSFSAAGRLDDGRGGAIARVNLFNYAGFVVGAPLVGAVGAIAGLRWGWIAPLLLVATAGVLASRLAPADARDAPATAPAPRRD